MPEKRSALAVAEGEVTPASKYRKLNTAPNPGPEHQSSHGWHSRSDKCAANVAGNSASQTSPQQADRSPMEKSVQYRDRTLELQDPMEGGVNAGESKQAYKDWRKDFLNRLKQMQA